VFQTEQLSGVSTSFALYDRETVERLIRDEPELLQPPGREVKKTFAEFDAYKRGEAVSLDKATEKKFKKLIKANRDIRWQKGELQSAALQAVLQGESIPHFASRIAKELPVKNEAAAVRYARTAMTAAQNAGRVGSYKRARDLGIDVSEQWLAVHDSTTRNSHRRLDGEIRPIGERFSNGLMYPGDPSGKASEVWNCRCTLAPTLNGYGFGTDVKPAGKIDGKTYEEWKNEHKR
jgi:SPP1 gp7 family putative phage head morphogenesis protein